MRNEDRKEPSPDSNHIVGDYSHPQAIKDKEDPASPQNSLIEEYGLFDKIIGY